MRSRALGLALVVLSFGCATNNVAELAGQVQVLAYNGDTLGCRPIRAVHGAGMTLTGARQQAQRRTLFLGGNVVVAGIWAGVTRPGSALPQDHRGTFSGFAFDCPQVPALASQLVGVTWAPANRIAVSHDPPNGCDEMGPPFETFADGPPGSAEDGLRRQAELADANYVRILKTVDHDGRPALRGQPYACPVEGAARSERKFYEPAP